jgi:predicted nucleic acid-binding protein
MISYVVDASVAIQAVISDVYTLQADTLFALASNKSAELCVPDFCLLECTNVIWKQVRFHNMPQNEAESLVQDLQAYVLNIFPSSALLPRSLEIGLTHQLAVYDSVYIALAEKLNCALITVDERQEKAAIAIGINIKAVTDFVS